MNLGRRPGGLRKPARATTTPLLAEINVTPLVDVVLVLLIIFMVVTPMLTRGPAIELPFSRHHDRKADTGERLVVSVDAGGHLYLDTRSLDAASLQSEIERVLRQTPSREVLLRGDRNLPFREARRALDAIMRSGALAVELSSKGEGEEAAK